MFLWLRNSLIFLFIVAIFFGLVLSPIFLFSQETLAKTVETSLIVTVSTPCGNGVQEGSEQCDGSDLGGQTCVGLGYVSGTLSCQANCTFDTSNCVSGGGGGGGGTPYVPPSATKVIVQGKAYPLSLITILQDGRVVTTTIADSQANFKVEITNITAGVCTFGVWGEDIEGRKSITFSFTTSVTSGMTTTISGIFLPPTIDLEDITLEKGEPLSILGQTAPESDVNIFVSSSNPEIVKKTKAEADGTWFYSFDTSILEEGTHTTRSKATSPEGLLSTFSQILSFYLGIEAPTTPENICPMADLNNDGRTNLIDFSILLYWWGKYNACADQNGNRIVDLPDFSIMMYWWTG
ncbi:hypothetical protein ACFL0A_01380 [Patescibacteria group bacterium]